MDQLKLAWVFRFWIAVGIVVLLPVIGYFVNTRSLAKDADAKKKALEGTKKQLQDLAKKDNPNDRWVDGVKKLQTVLEGDVNRTWVKLYQRQHAKYMTWPKDERGDYREIFETARDKKESVISEHLVWYKDAYPAQLDALVSSVRPTAVFRDKGLVIMDPDLVYDFKAKFVDAQEPPSEADAWLAQEDLWILRAMLDVVIQSNKGSSKWQESTVKKVLDIRFLSSDAAALDDRAKSKSGAEPRWGPSGQAADAAGKTATKDVRYIGSPDSKTLFKQVPVKMTLVVHQLRVPEVLGHFATSEIPMQITQVRFERASEAPPRPESAKSKTLPIPLKEDDFYHMTELQVWARAYLYEKPPEDVLAVAQPNTQPTEPDAAPSEPSPTQTEPSPTPEPANP